ncbi:3D-(3,5/4)-trihydroxycyclohexane-1,2-dione acylhydrolase (decyclizing) [Lichenicoccus sp.]|uniref:3D-(3,5/4)-trihydroxycyclohexane-1,2-dione acylhydrolase (decyclizing) n=1 Tax=Lichenicoccus sp. TaxID=2781899 RepID=UPI003D14F43D
MNDIIRLTTAQALVRMMAAQRAEIDGAQVPLFAGVWAIFGHGNVAAMGDALHEARDALPTYRAHSEQGMVHAATAFAKASRRRRMMACTTSIGPGALNMVTGAAVAHVSRLPLLLLPGDIFATRLPDPVLQQIEDWGDGTMSANDAFRPVSRYFDRITRPEQIVAAFARAMTVLTDPAECGPVTLALCQDVQAEAWDFPAHLFETRLHRPRRSRPDTDELTDAVRLIRNARRPLVIAGGGVLYSGAEAALAQFCADRGVPEAETQSGKSSLADAHPMATGGIGVAGTSAANSLAADADLVLAVGTRLQDFTTGSWSLFASQDLRIVGLNTQAFDAAKHAAVPLVADARAGIEALDAALADWRADSAWTESVARVRDEWRGAAASFTALPEPGRPAPPSDAEVIGAVRRACRPGDIVVCAAGGLPGELQKHWNTDEPLGYHVEYGFSCMGYEIAGGLGVKLAAPDREVVVMVGDGSYLMLNSELATSVMLGLRITVVLLDNHGFGCINRLQAACGGAPFNNLWRDSQNMRAPPAIDFVAHARSLGARAEKIDDLGGLADAMSRARDADRSTVLVIDTDPNATTTEGGHWWDVAVPAVSARREVETAYDAYLARRASQRVGN